jgi:ketopantoate reductase
MHITIVGAGTLGRIYGLRLVACGEEVAFLVRPRRAADSSPFVIEQINGSRRRDVLERPTRVVAVPPGTQVILVAVRFEQIDGSLIEVLRAERAAPMVVLTPLLPAQNRALEAGLGRAITPAMPSISGYLDERDVARYWTVKVASTLIDAPPQGEHGAAASASLEELARRLTKAGIASHLERDVGATNVATTTTFFPLIAAINAGSGIDGVLADKALLSLVIEAAKESSALGQKLGKAAPWANLLTRFIGPYTLKPGVALGRRLFPEVIRFVDAHFGPKLHEQHVAMGAAILELGREHGQAMPALTQLMERLRAAGPAA